MTEPGTSVYQRVPSERFALLAPELQRYFSSPDAANIGRGTGVYEVAGSRHRWLRPLLAYLAWRHILFPERARNVPFGVTNRANADGSLSAERTFSFARKTRVMEDTMRVVDGELHDFLGKRRGLEVRLALDVVDGGLTMRSGRAWLHLGALRLRLPPILSATVVLSERWDTDAQRVDVVMLHPVLGEIFEYRGRFTYRYEPDTEVAPG